MNILLVSPLPPPVGGIAAWTEKYSTYCKQHNISLAVVNTALRGKRVDWSNKRRNILDEICRTNSIFSEMKRQLKETCIDIVHINTSCGSFGIFRDFLCMQKAYKKRIPVVLHCHCNIQDSLRNKMAKNVFARMSKMSEVVLVLNKDSYNFVQQYVKKKPIIMPNFIESNFISCTFKVREKIREVVFVGRVQRLKGCFEIFEVACKLSDMHFTLIGSVEDEIKGLECPSNVSLVGEKSSEIVKKYLEDSDVFLFPSYTEGFSLALMEAMACGLPSIATRVGANEEMLEDKGGIIIPVGSSDAIVMALRKIDDFLLREQMSEWNIDKVKKNYLIDVVMGRLIKVYEGLLDES